MNKNHRGEVIVNIDKENKNRVMIGIPITGLVRAEWAIGRWGQTTPTNWSQSEVLAWLDQVSPLNFTVPNARNIIVHQAVTRGYEWVFFLDHDVILPPMSLIKINEHMRSGKYPIVNGLYFTKSKPAEPLIYRGSGVSYYDKWTMGEMVWASGTGLGCTLIHCSILKTIWEDSEEYTTGGNTARRVFRNPLEYKFNEDKQSWGTFTGTEDLDFYNRLLDGGYYKRAGWPEFQRKKYPLIIDTSLFCRHIDNNGLQFPAAGEEFQFMKAEQLTRELDTLKKYGPRSAARTQRPV